MSYNGWSNYETWAVNLHICNDPGLAEHVRNMAESVVDDYTPKDQLDDLTEKSAEGELADRLESLVYDLTYDADADNLMAQDLLQASINKVDFMEIAEGFVMDAEPVEA